MSRGRTSEVPSHPSGGSAEWPQSPSETAEVALGVAAALEEASRHTALLLLVQRAARARVGERVDVGAALAEWDLPAEDTSKLLAWLVQEPPEFDGQPVPLVVDTATGSLYRTASDTWEKAYTTTAGLWGTILALGLVIAVFALLRAAHITTWPADWFPKLVVLYLCVVGGAAAHIASKALANISFDDPLTIYAASRGLDWLRLRWLSILRLLIPIVVVTGSLWGAGNIPTHFQDIGVAVLSGYSADFTVPETPSPSSPRRRAKSFAGLRGEAGVPGGGNAVEQGRDRQEHEPEPGRDQRPAGRRHGVHAEVERGVLVAGIGDRPPPQVDPGRLEALGVGLPVVADLVVGDHRPAALAVIADPAGPHVVPG